MLSDRNISDINDQIRSELREVDSMMSSNEDKMAALERIAKLKSLLDSPTESETCVRLDPNQIAEALTTRPNFLEPSLLEKVIDALITLRRR